MCANVNLFESKKSSKQQYNYCMLYCRYESYYVVPLGRKKSAKKGVSP